METKPTPKKVVSTTPKTVKPTPKVESKTTKKEVSSTPKTVKPTPKVEPKTTKKEVSSTPKTVKPTPKVEPKPVKNDTVTQSAVKPTPKPLKPIKKDELVDAPLEVRAIAKTQRIAPRKARLVIDLIRGQNVDKAKAILMFTPKAASPIILKTLNSAISNAVNNFKMKEESLYVKTCFVGEGMTMKRMRPRAKGSGAPIMKRTSHITIILDTRDKE